MKRTFLLFAVAAVFAACGGQSETSSGSGEVQSVSAGEPDASNAPVFKFEKETYDFGEITAGEKVIYDFKFTNTGNSPLIITSATATCGCTVPDYPKEPVAPGAEGSIRVVFDSTNQPGMQNKVVTIVANTVPQTTQVNILGNVMNPETAQN